jgi:hypothetical protein
MLTCCLLLASCWLLAVLKWVDHAYNYGSWRVA